jgi:hypothetical protein
MDFQNCLNNFPWNRFGTVYETNSKSLKEKFLKIFNGSAEPLDYKYVIDRLEHQETLYRITPWGLKFYIYLIDVDKADKSILLQDIKVLFEAANYNNQGDVATKYSPTKGKIAKYEQVKLKLFDDNFDGTMDDDYLKLFKSIDRNFMQRSIIEYISHKKSVIEQFVKSNDKNISQNAISLINSINNPREYKFG